jgi:hypothetical protein
MYRGRLTWTEILAEIKLQAGQANAPLQSQEDIRYFEPADIELLLLEESNAILGDLRVDEFESIGPPAVQTLTAAAVAVAHPLNTIDILSATIDGKPAVEVTPSMYKSLRETDMYIYSVFSKAIHFTQANGSFTVLVEPSLAEWQADPMILPIGNEREQIRRVVDILRGIDNMR